MAFSLKTKKIFATAFLSILGMFLGVSEVSAAVSAASGYFVKCTTGWCTNDVTIGFQPKAVIFHWTADISTTAFNADSASAGLGFSDGGTGNGSHASTMTWFQDFDTPSTQDIARILSTTTAISIITESDSTIDAQATTTFNATGFQVGWSSANASGAQVIMYYALGGSDITNVDVGHLNIPVATGALSYSGLSFQPDFLMFLNNVSSGSSSFDSVIGDGAIGVGMATSSVAQVTVNTGFRDFAYDAGHAQSDASVIFGSRRGNAVDAIGKFTSMDSNGFTINVTDAPNGLYDVPFLAIKGGKHRIQSFSQPTSAGSQAITDAGFQPVGLAMFSVNDTVANDTNRNVDPAVRFSFGTAASTGGQSIWMHGVFPSVNPDGSSLATTTKIIVMASSTPSIQAHAELTSLDSTGFTLNWINADATERKIFYWAIGSESAAGGEPTGRKVRLFKGLILKILTGKLILYKQ